METRNSIQSTQSGEIILLSAFVIFMITCGFAGVMLIAGMIL